MANARFPSPLVKPGVPISGTRLSDWLHRKAHDGRPLICWFRATTRRHGTVFVKQ